MKPQWKDAGNGCWRDRVGDVEVRFLGKQPERSLVALAGTNAPTKRLVHLEQVHGGRVVEAQPGQTERADGVVSLRSDVVLAVVTADCVPVVLARGARIAAVHAGWRGLVAGVIPEAVSALGHAPADVQAWVGPAIGPCCYEVSADVADQVVQASGPAICLPGPRGRPHLALTEAACRQLRGAGVHKIRTVDACTRCRPDLWSYRGDGPGAGRNVTLVWMGSP